MGYEYGLVLAEIFRYLSCYLLRQSHAFERCEMRRWCQNEVEARGEGIVLLLAVLQLEVLDGNRVRKHY